MAKLNVENKVFKLPINVEANGIVTKVLTTADTYLDKNIEVTVNTPDAEFEVKQAAAVTATVSNKDTTYTSDTATPYPITIAADATAGAVTIGTKTAGFTAASDTVTVEAANAEQATKTIYVKEGTLTASGEAQATGNNGLTLGEALTSAPEDGFYIKASAAGGAKVTAAGWLPLNASAEGAGDAYYPVAKAVFSNNETGEFEELNGPVLVSGGFLYIKEGYIKNSKISLATLVPDKANVAAGESGNSHLIYNTVSVYDNDGNLVAGTMGDATLGAIVANGAAATIDTVSVAADGAGFKVSGTKAIAGTATVAIAQAGYATEELNKTGAISGEAKVDATLAKIGLAIDTPAAMTVTPEIAKEDATTVKSGVITTTAPTSGRYVAVSTAAIEASTEVAPKVATEGYGTADVFNAAGATVTGGAAASGTYYIPVNAGSHTATMADPTIVNATAVVSTTTDASEGFDGSLEAGILSAAPSGEYIKIDATAAPTKGSVSGNVTCTAVEGYIEAGQETKTVSGEVAVNVTAAAAKYIRVYDGTILD